METGRQTETNSPETTSATQQNTAPAQTFTDKAKDVVSKAVDFLKPKRPQEKAEGESVQGDFITKEAFDKGIQEAWSEYKKEIEAKLNPIVEVHAKEQERQHISLLEELVKNGNIVFEGKTKLFRNDGIFRTQ